MTAVYTGLLNILDTEDASDCMNGAGMSTSETEDWRSKTAVFCLVIVRLLC